MPKSLSPEKIRLLYSTLFELATVGTVPVLPPAAVDDPYDELMAQLSLVGTRLASLRKHLLLPPQQYAYHPVAPFVAVLDRGHLLRSFTPAVAERVGLSPERLRGQRFTELLDAASRDAFSVAAQQAALPSEALQSVDLLLVTASGHRVPLYCWVAPELVAGLLVVVAVEYTLLDLSPQRTSRNGRQSAGVRKAERTYAHILQHLDQPLPPARQLGLLVGMSESGLRRVFRERYGKSLYACYQELRMQKAWGLIRYTDDPLSEIARLCGFEEYLNFYKVFKKRFGVAPSMVGRKG